MKDQLWELWGKHYASVDIMIVSASIALFSIPYNLLTIKGFFLIQREKARGILKFIKERSQ